MTACVGRAGLRGHLVALLCACVHTRVDVKIKERLESQSAAQWKITEEVLQVNSIEHANVLN